MALSLLVGSVPVSATGPLAPADAWDRYTRPARWPGWSPHLREVDYPHPTIRPGTTGRVTGVGGVVAVFRIDEVDDVAMTWSWSVRSGPLRVRFEHGIDPVADGSEHAGGSRGWLVMHAPWPVALGYAPLARWSLGRLVARD